MKFISVTTILIFLLFSCKKKEEAVDKCTNGFKDPGETNIDCGGKCAPCPTVYFPSVQCLYNGKTTGFSSFELDHSSSNYSLKFYNDSLYVQLNLGIYDTVATYDITPNGSFITKSNTSFNYTYNDISSAKVSISEHDKSARRMSGFFTVDFYQANSGADTVRISSGSFTDLLY
jgi:hypothetical protein